MNRRSWIAVVVGGIAGLFVRRQAPAAPLIDLPPLEVAAINYEVMKAMHKFPTRPHSLFTSGYLQTTNLTISET